MKPLKWIGCFPAYATVIFFFLGASYTAYHWRANVPVALLGLALTIILAGILIGSKFSLIIAVAATSTIIITGIQEIQDVTLAPWRQELTTIHDIIEFTLLLLLIAVAVWLSSHGLERSLKRVKESENNLRIERDNLEVKVQERTRDLQQAQLEKLTQIYRFAEFGRLSSGLFHDLVNPLSVLSIIIEQISTNKSKYDYKTTTLENNLKNALQASRRLEKFVSAIQKYHQSYEKYTRFSVQSEIQEAITLISYKIQDSYINLTCEPVPATIELYGDPLKFHQIIINLLTNAIYACEHSIFPKRYCRISAHQTTYPPFLKPHVIITVSDNGCGIPLMHQDKIFIPFFTTKPTHQGTGLGLSTVKSIIEKHFKGTISVESIPYKDTTFTISIPV